MPFPPPTMLFLIGEHSFSVIKSSWYSPMGVFLTYRMRKKQIMSSFQQGKKFTLNFHDLAFACLLYSPCSHYIFLIYFDSFLYFPHSHSFLSLSYHNIKYQTFMTSHKPSLNDLAEEHCFKCLSSTPSCFFFSLGLEYLSSIPCVYCFHQHDII